MGVMAHLKGAFTPEGMRLLLRSFESNAIPRARIWMVSHRGQSLGLAKREDPAIRCGQFGWGAAMRQCFCATTQREAILLNELTITRSIVRKLHARGLKVFASCVWETRSEEALSRLEVDGFFRNIVPGRT